MSDTPRTDAAAFQLPYNNGTWAGGKKEVVNANDARDLERELAAMTVERDAGNAALANVARLMDSVSKAEVEKLREALSRLIAIEDGPDMYGWRDAMQDARAALKETK